MTDDQIIKKGKLSSQTWVDNLGQSLGDVAFLLSVKFSEPHASIYTVST